MALGVGAMMTASVFGMAACDPGTDGGHTHDYKYVSDGASGHHQECKSCDDKKGIEDHVYDDANDTTCNKCDYVRTIGDGKTDEEKLWGTVVNEQDSDIADETVTAAQVPAPKVTEKTGNGPALTNDGGTSTAKSELLVETAGIDTSAADWTNGMFTVSQGTTIDANRSKTGVYENGEKIDNTKYSVAIRLDSKKTFSINAVGKGTWVLYVYNGSSNTETQTMVLTDAQGQTSNINYPASSNSNNLQKVTIQIPSEGKYSLACGGVSFILYSCVEAEVSVTPIESIKVVNAGKTDYLVGQQLDCTGIAVNAVHAVSGRLSTVDNAHLTVDTSAYNPAQAGTYSIGIDYEVEGNLTSDTKTFHTSYDVTVYAFDALELGFNSVDKAAKGSAAGNSVYYNTAVKQFYFNGSTLSTDGLTVKAIGKSGESTKVFKLGSSEYSVASVDMTSNGRKSVKVSAVFNGLKKTECFGIYVAPKYAELTTAAEVVLNVNGAYTGWVGKADNNGAYQFKTVQQAIDFLNAANLGASVKKTINLAAGTYAEKLEIEVPNLTIKGADKDTTIIEWDSLFGLEDEGGFVHTTDSTATLNVRDKAENFTLENVTVNNKWCTQAYFDEKLGAGYSEHRALAVLIQADKVVIDNCAINGYQDTIELFTGRQLIMNTYISGTTDFIFGTNNTTYFYKCTIHSISNGKPDGGYITAFKGNNKGDDDYVTYGAIFDECHFTADSDVLNNHNTAIARPWAKYSAVAVINSTLEGHISKTPYDGSATKNQRYVGGLASGVTPLTQGIKFFEYGNSGDGALEAEVAGMKMLSPEEAANYSDLTKVFGKTNGKVTYSDVWNVTVSK